jgi:hypothetical protein
LPLQSSDRHESHPGHTTQILPFLRHQQDLRSRRYFTTPAVNKVRE